MDAMLQGAWLSQKRVITSASERIPTPLSPEIVSDAIPFPVSWPSAGDVSTSSASSLIGLLPEVIFGDESSAAALIG